MKTKKILISASALSGGVINPIRYTHWEDATRTAGRPAAGAEED